MKGAKSLNKYEPWTVGLAGGTWGSSRVHRRPRCHTASRHSPVKARGGVVLDVRRMDTRVSCEGRGLGHTGGAWSLGQGLTVNAELSGKVGTHAEGWAGRSAWLNAAETRSEHSGLWGSLGEHSRGWSGRSRDHWDR